MHTSRKLTNTTVSIAWNGDKHHNRGEYECKRLVWRLAICYTRRMSKQFFVSIGIVGLGLLSLGRGVFAQNPNISFYSSKYKENLDIYRTQSEQMTIALQQYTKLQTLSSQEEAVRAMRDFLLIRSDVVTSHFNLLQAILGDRSTVNPEWMASSSGLLEKQLGELASHHSRADVAVDRIRADQEAVWFLQNEKPLILTSDRAVCLIGMGRVAESIVALEQVKKDIDAWIDTASMSETQKVEKRRGSDELGRAIASAQSSLTQAEALFVQNTESSSDVAFYPRLRPVLLTSYTHVLRGVEYAKELTQ